MSDYPSLFGTVESSVVPALSVRIRKRAVLYVDVDVLDRVEPYPRRKRMLEHRGRARSMYRVSADDHHRCDTPRLLNKRFRVPLEDVYTKTKIVRRPGPFYYLLDGSKRARWERTENTAPRWLCRHVDGVAVGDRLWLRSLADVVWVCAWPWSAAWASTQLWKRLTESPASREILADELLAGGQALGETLRLWARAHELRERERPPPLADRLALSCAIYDATRELRSRHTALLGALETDERAGLDAPSEFTRRLRARLETP